MNIVENKSKKILINAIRDLSFKEKTDNMNVQLLVKYYKNGFNFFGLNNYSKNLGYIPLSKLYPAHMDIFGIRNQIPAFLENLADKIANQINKDKKEIMFIVAHKRHDLKTLFVTAYHNNKIVNIMSWKQVFGQEAMLEMVTN